MLQSVLKNYAFNLQYLKMLVADIPEDEMCDQPAGLANHPAWTIGHLSAAAQFGISLLGGESSLPEGWAELFGRGSTPVSDPSKYPSKAELLAEFERCHKLITEAAAAAGDAKLAEATPDPDFRQIMPTLSDAVVFILLNHTATHLGQTTMWRRAKGLGAVLG
jgi:hypothetical protein